MNYLGCEAADDSSAVFGKPIRTEIGSGIFSSGSVQNCSEPFSSKYPQKLEKDIKKCLSTVKFLGKNFKCLLQWLEPVPSRTELNGFRNEISVRFQFNRKPITTLTHTRRP